MIVNDRDLNDVGQFIAAELAKELIKQDHSATGKLIASLDWNIINSAVGTVLQVTMNDYGKYVNTGRKRGARKVPVDVLVEWVKQKGIATNNKKAVGIAFAIQKTIEKEGIPTVNSRKRGKRIEFIDDTLMRINNEVTRRLTEAAGKTIEIEVANLVKRI